LDTVELTYPSDFLVLFEAGGLLFLANFLAGVLLKPYSDFFLRKDLLSKTFRIDTNDQDKLVGRGSEAVQPLGPESARE